MGKTFRRDDDSRNSKKQKHPNHSNGRKTGGMRIINDVYDEDDDFLDDEVSIQDQITINKTSDDS